MTDTTETTVAATTETVAASTETAATAAAVDIGGTETAATAETADIGASKRKAGKTPGKAVRAKSDAEKRSYTARGTTYWCRRVILLNGAPVGRGRPAAEGKGERKVVYVPVGMEYDVAVHGEGVKYNSNSHKATHKRIRKDTVNYTFDDGVAPAKNAKPAKKKAAKKSAKPAKKKAAKKSAKAGKPVTAPVVDVPAPAETAVATAPVVEVPVATDAVTA